MLETLVLQFERVAFESLEELEIGTAWLEFATPLVRERVEGAASQFPRRRALDLPYPHGIYDAFMREAGDVHRSLFPGNEELYGEDVRAKLTRCLEITDAEDEAARRARAAYPEAVEALFAGLDLLVTPTLPFVAPPTGQSELALRGDLTRFTYAFNVLGWPALALPCGSAEDGLPASVQLVGRAGDDARVLAAGSLLERALSLD
jgi:aspartyl-tRNA(Asn)/glutamyl-tRNA(Gln) amidotransferase subunit A